MRMLRLGHPLAFGKVAVDLLLIGQIICQRAMHFFEGQCRITLYHALDGHLFAEEINQRIQGNTGVSHSINVLYLLHVFLMHRLTPNSFSGPRLRWWLFQPGPSGYSPTYYITPKAD